MEIFRVGKSLGHQIFFLGIKGRRLNRDDGAAYHVATLKVDTGKEDLINLTH